MKVQSICDELIWEQRKKVKIKKKRGLKTVKEVSTTEPGQNYPPLLNLVQSWFEMFPVDVS